MFGIGIGFRTIKTAVGTGASIAIAELLSLSFSPSAGIMTILCIQPTKKRSLRTALSRILACMQGLFLASLLFLWFGYHPITLVGLFLVHIPLLVRLRLQESLVTSTVVVFHLYTAKELTVPFLLNEIQLILIGVGVALLLNLYMPSNELKLKKVTQNIESNFQMIFRQLAFFVRSGDTAWSGKELVETAQLLEQARNIAMQMLENQLLRKQDKHYRYVKMRERQFERIEQMLPLVSSIDLHVKQCHDVADLFDYLSAHLSDNPQQLLEYWKSKRDVFKEMDLPASRDEFETRASLYALLNDMEQYILIEMEAN